MSLAGGNEIGISRGTEADQNWLAPAQPFQQGSPLSPPNPSITTTLRLSPLCPFSLPSRGRCPIARHVCRYSSFVHGLREARRPQEQGRRRYRPFCSQGPRPLLQVRLRWRCLLLRDPRCLHPRRCVRANCPRRPACARLPMASFLTPYVTSLHRHTATNINAASRPVSSLTPSPTTTV